MAEEQTDDVALRPFWSGTITFGLVSIPVALFPANRSSGVSLRMVSPDGVPLQRRYFCSKDERELDRDEIVRGYEVAKDEYVVVTDEELERLAPEKTRDIDLRRFVDSSQLDPLFFERAYYLAPDGNSTKAYRLLARTMEEAERAGIATFVMRGKEYLVAILAENGILRAETLRFADEVRTAEDLDIGDLPKPQAASVKKFRDAIRRLKKKQLAESELVDGEAERMEKLVKKKLAAGEAVHEVPEVAVAASEGVIDLMEVLRRSLQAGSGGKRPARKAAGRTRSSSGSGSKKRGGATKSTGTDALDSESKQALYERARKLDIEGRSSMTKQQLIRAIRKSA